MQLLSRGTKRLHARLTSCPSQPHVASKAPSRPSCKEQETKAILRHIPQEYWSCTETYTSAALKLSSRRRQLCPAVEDPVMEHISRHLKVFLQNCVSPSAFRACLCPLLPSPVVGAGSSEAEQVSALRKTWEGNKPPASGVLRRPGSEQQAV